MVAGAATARLITWRRRFESCRGHRFRSSSEGVFGAAEGAGPYVVPIVWRSLDFLVESEKLLALVTGWHRLALI